VPDRGFERLSDKALIGNAGTCCRGFDRVEQRLGNPQIDALTFGLNSNRTIRSPLRSYSVRSASATNRSASSSVRSSGSGFFIAFNLFQVQETRADRANERLPIMLAQREHDQDVPPFLGSADRFETLFVAGVDGIGKDTDRPAKSGLDGCDRNTVLPAFVAIGTISRSGPASRKNAAAL